MNLSRRYCLCFTILICFFLTGRSHRLYAFDTARTAGQATNIIRPGGISYENATITEDATWKGTVIVRGHLVVSPQATVRVEPGTVVKFIKSAVSRRQPRLVVLGRFHCEGTVERPVLFTSNPDKPAKGDWGGILFLSSEKRNRLAYFAIEGAETGLELRYSSISLSNGRIERSDNGIFAGDSILNMESVRITGSNKGLESINSEVEIRGGHFAKCRDGIIASHTTLVMASASISGSVLHGILARDCRVRIRSCELFDNALGAVFKGGEGQLFLSGFRNNRETALHLSGARIKVNSCLFNDNLRDAVKVDDGLGLFLGSVFTGNKGFNIVNTGRENVSAVHNWWGSNSESDIMSKLHARHGRIMVSPWLPSKPSALPF